MKKRDKFWWAEMVIGVVGIAGGIATLFLVIVAKTFGWFN